MTGRRQVLRGLGTAAAATVFSARADASPAPTPPASPVVDFHVHLFGAGHGGTGCFLSKKQQAGLTYGFLKRLLDIDDSAAMDAQYLARILAFVRGSSVTRAVLLAQDGRYDAAGRLDLGSTSVYVPNDYLLDVCRRHPADFVPCVSINPKRRDALDELSRCVEAGARILKIHPPIQAVDPGDPAFRGFYRRCAELGVLVMVHTGAEHSAEIIGHEVCRPSRLELALDEGCLVLAAHAGTSSFFDREDFLPELLALVARYPQLYAETAVTCAWHRFRELPRILEHPELVDRLVHASDVPFPANPLAFWHRVSPGALAGLLPTRNLLERDLQLKRALGVPAVVFERGAQLLARLGV